MRAAALENAPTAAASRLLANVHALDALETHVPAPREPALIRLEAVLGRDFADRLVAALSDERHDRSS
jgi:hypothetical protein